MLTRLDSVAYNLLQIGRMYKWVRWPTILILCISGCGSVTSGSSDGAVVDDTDSAVAEIDSGVAEIDMPTCTPRPCSAECGVVANGCGDTMNCGKCPNFAFITSATTTGDIGGINGARNACLLAALDAGLSGTYRPWLSTRTTDARDTFSAAAGWVRLDGKLVAQTVDDLAMGRLVHPINITETGAMAPPGALAWTGSANGQVAGVLHCDSFDSAEGIAFGIASNAHTPLAWGEPALLQCHAPAHIYCLGVDHDEPNAVTLPEKDDSTRIAFVSSPFDIQPTGIAAADAHCNADAAAADLGDRKFHALLATSTQAAADRLNLSGPTWARVDGVRLYDRAMDLRMEPPLTAVALDATGKSLENEPVWTGTTSPSTVGENNETCDDWTNPDAPFLARLGTHSGAQPWITTQRGRCDSPRSLLCFEK